MTTHKTDEERALGRFQCGYCAAQFDDEGLLYLHALMRHDNPIPPSKQRIAFAAQTPQPECLADDVERRAFAMDCPNCDMPLHSDGGCYYPECDDPRPPNAAMPLASRGVDREAVADFDTLHKDYGRAARLITVMREKWQAVSDALDDIPGGMHADLEDAASAMASVCDDPLAALAQPLPTARGDEAWLIELDGPHGVTYYMGSRFDPDHMKAMRFAREADAKAFCDIYLSDPRHTVAHPQYTRIAEHVWQ